ncbi:phosphoribosyltransferase family protein [Actinoplanes sp. NPDC026619]|uniref:phosphoribosyltransferase family protein n=1 Tax=Actinoplanes sp. NPDC026619 TaxID=3155798 RepID=UPI0033FBF3E1
MMRSTRLAIHNLRATGTGQLVTQNGDFDAVAYSQMKYGHIVPARRYGYQLAEMLTAGGAFTPVDPIRPIVVYGPATRHTPKPAHAIAVYFTQLFNHLRAQRDLRPAQLHEVKHVEQGEPVRYAALDHAGRRTALAGTIDYVDPNIIKDACVICIDDLIVTGAVEDKMSETLAPLRPAEVHYLYAVWLDPKLAGQDPAIEERINNASTPTPASVARFIERDEFILNDRVLRELLTWPDRGEVQAFLADRSDLFLEHLVTELASVGVPYHRLSVHLLECLLEALERRNHPVVLALKLAAAD